MVTRLLSLDFQPDWRVATTGTLRSKGVPFPRPQHFISRSIKRGSLKGLIVYNYPPVEGEVSNGVDIPRREASRYTPRAVHRP